MLTNTFCVCFEREADLTQIAKFRNFFMDPGILAMCESWKPLIFARKAAPKVEKVLRFVTRFHPTRVGFGSV